MIKESKHVELQCMEEKRWISKTSSLRGILKQWNNTLIHVFIFQFPPQSVRCSTSRNENQFHQFRVLIPILYAFSAAKEMLYRLRLTYVSIMKIIIIDLKSILKRLWLILSVGMCCSIGLVISSFGIRFTEVNKLPTFYFETSNKYNTNALNLQTFLQEKKRNSSL